MRCFEPLLWQSGAGSITDVALDLDSRYDIPQLLLGLQYLYINPALREQVLQSQLGALSTVGSLALWAQPEF